MDEVAFNTKYWFSNMKIVTVVNPREEDFVFGATVETGVDIATGKLKSEQRTYRVKAGTSERLPGPIANMYLDQMSKLIAQDEDKFQYMIDFALKAEYYDALISDSEDLIETYQPLPQYLQSSPRVETVDEPAFAGKDSDEQPQTVGAGTQETAKNPVGRPKKVA